MNKKIFRRVVVIVALFTFFSYLSSSCLEFRMSKSEIDKYFEQQSLKPTLHTVELGERSVNYAYLHAGQLPLVVFAHGAPGSLSSFIHFLNDKALQAKVNMISYDRPGYGYSNFGWAEPSLDVHVDFLAEIIKRHKDGEPVYLVGHSLGGPIVAKLAMKYPELTDGIVIVAGSIDPAQEKQEWYRPLGRNFIGKSLLPKSLWVTNEEIIFLKDELEKMVPYWGDLKVPVIVIHGDEDNLVPIANAHFAQKMIDREYLELWLQSGVNHFIPWNNSELITQAILRQIEMSAIAGENNAQ